MHETASLIDRARGGSESAWHALFAREERRVIAVLLSALRDAANRVHLVDELLQQVRVEAHRKIDEFTPSGPGAFGAWLCAIARNKARSCRRDEARENGRKDGTPSDDVPSARTTPSSRAIQRELESLGLRALDRLSPAHREVILLRFFERMSPKAVAESMDRTEEAVRALYYRAIKSLGRHAKSL